MKNELLANAITEIDDALIVAARTDVRSAKRRLPPRRAMCAAAACFLLLCGIAFLLLRGSAPRIVVNGQTLGKAPIQIDALSPASSDLRLYGEGEFAILLELKSRETLSLRTDAGSIEVYSETQQLLSAGKECTQRGPFTVCWTIPSPDTEMTYTLHLDPGGTVLTLSYDRQQGHWILSKS